MFDKKDPHRHEANVTETYLQCPMANGGNEWTHFFIATWVNGKLN